MNADENKAELRILSRHVFIQWLAHINELDEWLDLTNEYTERLLTTYHGDDLISWYSISKELSTTYGMSMISVAFLQDDDLPKVIYDKWDALAHDWGMLHLKLMGLYDD